MNDNVLGFLVIAGTTLPSAWSFATMSAPSKANGAPDWVYRRRRLFTFLSAGLGVTMLAAALLVSYVPE